MSIKHPEITVRLSNEDGNAFFIIGRVQKALRRAGVSDEEIREYAAEAMAGDYDHLLRTTMAWVDTK